MSALLVVLAVAGLWIGAQERDAQARADDRQAVLQAAGSHAVNLLSLHYKTVDADTRRILDSSTGVAREEYEANLGRLKSTTVANKVVQDGVLRATGLVSMTGSAARVLVVADVDIRWEGSKTPPQDRFYRWSMDLTKVGGAWLVSKAVQM
ncbi:hypothetical protein [Nonomuraea roseoviolacea]|uniref:Mce-associated membrane protein n=1 Tax=Nonomuraea roseoviolacea subsp. carminata TaxID=160689 RepID=A0ABT1JWW6_9ACTN|nr:hypothetical protein [Nonomuraea roseoviolacea]MCP2346247.1 Mce-associated membrane protein [Nonomuraea roseoviolacea subsp. carminata]